MVFSEFTAGKDDDGRRLDRILRILLRESALTEIYRGLRKGFILLNGKKARPDTKVREGDTVSVARFMRLGRESQSPQTGSFGTGGLNFPPVIFSNSHIVIFDKPYDVPVHGTGSVESAVRERLRSLSRCGGSLAFTPGPLHRLDRKTTGLLVFSESIDGARWFSSAVRGHSVGKKYRGVILGILDGPRRWSDGISRNPTEGFGFRTVSVTDAADSRNALTYAAPLMYGKFRGDDVTLAEFTIGTGRTHQIRAQSSAHGFPLLGDSAYGGGNPAGPRDFFLHAAELVFPENPVGLPPSVISPPDDVFMNFVKKTCSMTESGL